MIKRVIKQALFKKPKLEEEAPTCYAREAIISPVLRPHCSCCGRTLYLRVAYLIYQNEWQLDHCIPYDAYCKKCFKEYFPGAKIVKDNHKQEQELEWTPELRKHLFITIVYEALRDEARHSFERDQIEAAIKLFARGDTKGGEVAELVARCIEKEAASYIPEIKQLFGEEEDGAKTEG
jgi:hypothetical protein